MSGDNTMTAAEMGRWVLIFLCAIFVCGSAGYFLFYGQDKVSAEKEFRQIGESSRNLSALYARNSDLIGWIRIDGTKIDYPVMQTPGDPEYYLHRDFNKEYSDSGTPFMDTGSVALPRPAADGAATLDVTWNWLIYGHNMKFGTMFHDLLKYESQEFREKHQTFTFDVFHPETDVTDSGEYEIFAVCRTKIHAEESNAFSYYRYAGCTDEETFHEYAAGVKSESIYDTGIMPHFGDQLVTLSTCAYHVNEGRFYIVGRRIQ